MAAPEMKQVKLDLSGEVCPYTFVRAKLALEELAAGDELELFVDHRPAFISLPRSLREEGHELLRAEPAAAPTTGYVIAVRKRGP